MRRSVVLRFAGLAFASLVQAVTYIVLARTLGVAGFGSFSWIFAAGGLLVSVTGFGFTPRVLRTGEGAEGDRLRSLAVTMRLAMGLSILVALAVVGAATGVATGVVAVALAFVAIDAITDLCQAALAGVRRIGYATVLLIAQRLIVLVAALTLMTVWMPWVFGIVAAAVVAVNVASVVRTRPRVGELGATIVANRGYWAANLAASISQAEVPLITVFGGAPLAGLYAAGARAASPVNLLSQALLQVATPELTRSDKDARLALFRRTHRVTLWIVAAGVVLAVPAGLVGAWVLGPGFEAAWATVAGFVVGGTIMGANQAHQALLLAVGRPGLSARAVAIGAVTGVAAAAVIAATIGVPWLGLVPAIAQGTMYLLFRRAVRSLAA
ncbi:lipopolysaccharide biosynthesis protein [Microbacterium sp. No. 7]|uniref:lipopolysaccharide biosynthesis protein n=1 Tax=Microbacterium sp. No. 7 TaxID=1714373 RepID=UPI0006D092C0|nr:oligosaccharide flippase family protein [Microbacterium sp. No. 7]ALJ19044.1 hypothetical protein AOA12_03635 [Microbacterium sp. No. 7]